MSTEPAAGQTRVVRISPLGQTEIRLLAESRGVNADDFLAAVNKSQSANLMRQPLEVHNLLDVWKEQLSRHGSTKDIFASRLDVFRKVVSSQLRVDLTEERRSEIDPTAARKAVEKLAAAVSISEIRDLSAFGEIDNTLSAIDVLSSENASWSGSEVRQLLSGSLFHPSVGGRIRFAHRELEDFLAANFFDSAINANAGSLIPVSPMIATGLGKTQISQSTEHLMGWLATLNTIGRKYVTDLKPGLLIETGDPTLISNDERSEALRSQVALYKDRKYRGEWFYRDDIKKFATPALSTLVAELLASATSPEVREFLVRVARYGDMLGLADQLYAIAVDQNEGFHIRSEAILALNDFVSNVHRKAILKVALLSKIPDINDVDGAPAWNTYQLAALTYAYPESANLKDVRKILLRILREAKNYSSINSQLLEDIVEKSSKSDLPKWLALLVKLAVGPRNKENYLLPEVLPRYRCFAPVIGKTTAKLLKPNRTDEIDEILLDALEYLFQFSSDLSISMHGTPLRDVAIALKPETLLKRQLINRRITLLSMSNAKRPLPHGVTYPLTFGHNEKIPSIFSYEDIVSYCKDMKEANSKNSLHLAYEIANDLVFRIDENQERNKAELAVHFAAKRHGDKEIRGKAVFSIKNRILRRWYRFRHNEYYRWRSSLNNANRLVSKLFWRIRNIFTFIRHRQKLKQGTNQGFLVWGAQQAMNEPGRETIEAIRKLEGKTISHWFELGFRNFRKQCERDSIKPNTYLEIAGLVGLSLEAEAGPINATHAEALNAFRFAFGNLNGFPKWLPALAEAHPTAFKEIYEPLILGAFKSIPEDQDVRSEVLSKIAYSGVAIRAQVAPYIFEALQSIVPRGVTDLEISLLIVAKSFSIDSNSATDFFRSGFQLAIVSFDFVRAWSWLDALFITNANVAWQCLMDFVGEKWHGASASLLLQFIGRDLRSFSRAEEIAFERNDLVTNVTILRNMTKAAYLVFPPESDPRHEEVYSPGLKDRAADARRYYLNMLSSMNSKTALDAIDGLINDVKLKNHRDAFLNQRDRLVRNSARRPAYNKQETIEFLNGIGKSPNTITEFSSLVERQIVALLTKLKESDDNEGRVFRKGKADENDLRNWLSARLREAGDRHYTCSREAEMAVEKRTDIHINARSQALGKIPVEIKLAERWAVPELVKKLRSQLFNQYMLEDGSHTGFYVLINASKSNFRKKYKGSMISFEQLAEQLKMEANKMNAKLPKQKAVHVIVISLVP